MQADHYKCVMDMAVIAWIESKVGEILSDHIRMLTESGSPPWRGNVLIFYKNNLQYNKWTTKNNLCNI